MDTWGANGLINHFRMMLIHQILPDDATEEWLWIFYELYRNNFKKYPLHVDEFLAYKPEFMRFAKYSDPDNEYNPKRITVWHDSSKKIIDVSIG